MGGGGTMHVKGKALAVVSFIIVLLSGFYLVQGIAHQDREIEWMIEREEAEIDATVDDIERLSLHMYQFRIRQLAEFEPGIAEAFAGRDRDRLLETALPVYRALREENQYLHAWDFNLPDGTVFLRVQKPELHGDNIAGSRAVVQAVHETGTQASGYDIGKHGLIYWVAQPLYMDGRYLGAMEVGIDAIQLVDALEKRFETEVAMIVRAGRWSKATLAEKGFRHHGEYVLLADEGSAYGDIPDDFIFSVDNDQRIALGGGRYLLHCCSILRDFKGEPVANVLVLQDITDKVVGKRNFILVAVSLTALLALASFGVLYVSFGSLIGKLESYAEETRTAKEEIEKSRDQLEQRVKERTADLQATNVALEREVEERISAERAMKDSHERLLLVLDGLEAVVYVADMKTYDVLFINKFGRETFGDIVGKKCWQTIQSGQASPCSFCTNTKLVDAAGRPAGVCRWEFQGSEGGKWYHIQDRAIRWVDGRLVRLAILTDISERKVTEEKIRSSLREKELLLKEIHHRVKNNMQIISSLLNLESSAAAGAVERDIFRDSQSRIKAMSLIHEKLYRSGDIMTVDMQDYLRSLVKGLYSLYGESEEKVKARIRAEGIALGIDTAVLCGLITNELVTNSLRHAFPPGGGGTITVSVSGDEGQGGERNWELAVEDNGAGMPAGISMKNARTLGLQLVSMLVEHQLGGTVGVVRNGGTKIQVRFRELRYRRRT